MRYFLRGIALVIVLLAVYLLLWPVEISPVAWQAPALRLDDPRFKTNNDLRHIEYLDISPYRQPRRLTIGPDGFLYAATAQAIIQIQLNTHSPTPEQLRNPVIRPIVQTEGAATALWFDQQGLFYTDTEGLKQDDELLISTGQTGLIQQFVMDDQSIYFITQHPTQNLSLWLDLMEHGGHGRLWQFDRSSKQLTMLLTGLQRPVGLNLDPGSKDLLLAEAGTYQLTRFNLQTQTLNPVLANLPDYPAGLSFSGRYHWLALNGPRHAVIDEYSTQPWLRKLLLRILPAPEPTLQSMVVAVQGERIMRQLNDQEQRLPGITQVLETDDYFFFGHQQPLAVIGYFLKPDADLQFYDQPVQKR